MSSLQITGKLFSATPVEQKSDSFKVRQFTLEITETSASGQAFTNYAGFQLVNDKCSLIDTMYQGQPVTVHFNIRGNIWNDKTITNLQAWKVEAVQAQQPAPQQFPQQPQQAPQPQQPQQWPPAPQPQAPAQQQPQQAPWPQTQPQPTPWPQTQPQPGFGPQPATTFNPPAQTGNLPF